MMIDRCDILVIGAGLAGVALAARLGDWKRKVWVLEREEYSPCHATDRALCPWDPSLVVDDDTAALAWAGAAEWSDIPEAFEPKGMLHIFANDCLAAYTDAAVRGCRSGSGVQELEAEDAARRFPMIRFDWNAWGAALWTPAGAAGTVHMRRLYSHFRAALYRQAGRILLGESLESASYGGGAWTVRTSHRMIRADIVVNCAGAWADDVARRCETRRLGFHSTKRSALNLAVEPGADWPWRNVPQISWHGRGTTAYCDIHSNQRVSFSPPDEGSSWPCNAEPEPWQIAAAIDRFEQWTNLRLIEVSGVSWAWLRTTPIDGRPVIGWAREAPDFFWLTGFGASGPECALAGSAIAADMIRNSTEFSWLVDQYGIRSERFSPDRLGYAGVSA
jgi:D-arginine dehydrogenase